MYSFKNDYAEGAHQSILNKLIQTNEVQQAGYGEDDYTKEAKALIKKEIDNPDADIFFVSGGTQANLLVISSILRTHQAVISPQTGHIFANETGAIEATGHKVIGVPTANGKLTATDIETTVSQYGLRPHVVEPKMVYISNSTELGTIYTKAELEAISSICKQLGLYLFIDGARLGHALTASDNTLTLKDIAALTDVFYIGATKNGGLLGEAIIFNNKELATYFDYNLKQRGALLAKGRLLGIQFQCLFENNLYFDLAKHANAMAAKLTEAFKAKGYSFLVESTTNQIFPILPLTLIKELNEHYDFFTWKAIDDQHAAIRLITSWATRENIVDEFIEKIK
ncbi:aminotransferase class I/II-fold pyridoxal phosphate-dependent enzyme [Myroides marinus]|uniref:Threonine aldolase n=1 Tax=Myroides marinus TaxID=703342 RepID=A0A164ATM2_9FLAO|nr:aminotransferase class I/II-fold pyridoxal phosphate-dependent enzyme [Myroides marinus]KZE84870.1 threonine aldolase [Myroides marinus]MDM1354966.1 aminotransferase class I/II-fold pyridoxal phosphate-dependent enzyme [Myroides marinus]MDM1361752.1 aminotransferase class I/II-fold pyridoxal phosphate-dependent enzyme [Myroides marinus]MDM1368075.1 aminotransferase class I/II-fold pyridoxal phosphate-dependent enzyme [Myroides marinus]MDM1373058.1 aminotransferase class I/II-fold pyridoxal 